MKGRKPKLQVIEGGNGLSRCPPPPLWLSPHAKSEWKRVMPSLLSHKLFDDDMRGTLENYCVAAGMVRQYTEVLAREGDFVTTEQGPKSHPAARMLLAAARESRLLAAELGLTPHRRGRNGNDGGTDGDRWEGMLE